MTTQFILAQAAADNAAGAFLGFGIFTLILALVLGLFWLAMLIHALTNPALDSTGKIVWALVIFFVPFLGALAYLFVGRKGGVKV